MKARTNPGSRKDRADDGTFKYRNECQFMKVAEDEGNPAENPDLVEPRPEPDASRSIHSQVWGRFTRGETTTTNGGNSGNSGTQGMPSTMFELASGHAFLDRSGADSSSTSMTTNQDALSNRPTPNSSSTSDLRHNTAHDSGSLPSYDASPSTANDTSMSDMEAAAARFLHQAMSNGYHMSGDGTTLSPGQSFHPPATSSTIDFTLAGDWASMGAQSGGTPVAEGVLRNLMQNIGPLDASMDLGWDSGP